MAAFTNRVFSRINVGSSEGVRTVETVVADMGFGPPSEMADGGPDITEAEEAQRWPGLADVGAGGTGCGENGLFMRMAEGVRLARCDAIVAEAAEALEELDMREASSAPRMRMLGMGASSGDIVLMVSSKMVVGVSGRVRGFPCSSRGTKPDLFA